MTEPKGGKWTRAEDRIVIERYGDLGAAGTAALLPRRSPAAVASRATILRKEGEAIKLRCGGGPRNMRKRPEPADDPRFRPARRSCLGCGERFHSTHCGHRICTKCRPAVERLSGGIGVAGMGT